MLEVKNFTFTYTGGSKLWKPINLTLKEGQTALISGRNGSGKTTLLQCLCGIIPGYINGIAEGEINYKGESVSSIPIKALASEINILFQDPDKQIFMPTVEEEIAFGAENLCLTREQIFSSLTSIMKQLKIEHLRYKTTASLSFGQKKLVALAAILAMSPQIILIDEFCAGMEEATISLFSEYIKRMKNEGKIVIMADHHSSLHDWADMSLCLDSYTVKATDE